MLQNISGATDSDITRLVIKYENNRFIYSGKVNHDGNEHIIKLDGVTGEVVEQILEEQHDSLKLNGKYIKTCIDILVNKIKEFNGTCFYNYNFKNLVYNDLL